MRLRRCKHDRTRCIHGDEGWVRMKVYTFRWWKEMVVRRQACIDCGRALDRDSICSTYPGQHTLDRAALVGGPDSEQPT